MFTLDLRIKQMNLFKNLKKVIEDYWIWIFVILILSSGCSTTKWYHPEHYEWEADERLDGGWKKEEEKSENYS